MKQESMEEESMEQEKELSRRTLHENAQPEDYGIRLTAVPKIRYCVYCGAEVEEGEHYCYMCGKPLTLPEEDPADSAEASAAAAGMTGSNRSGAADEQMRKSSLPKDELRYLPILKEYIPKLPNQYPPAPRNHQYFFQPEPVDPLVQRVVSFFPAGLRDFYFSRITGRPDPEKLLAVYYSGHEKLYPLHTMLLFTDQSFYAVVSGYEFFNSFQLVYGNMAQVVLDETVVRIRTHSGETCLLTFSPKFVRGDRLRTMLDELRKEGNR